MPRNTPNPRPSFTKADREKAANQSGQTTNGSFFAKRPAPTTTTPTIDEAASQQPNKKQRLAADPEPRRAAQKTPQHSAVIVLSDDEAEPYQAKLPSALVHIHSGDDDDDSDFEPVKQTRHTRAAAFSFAQNQDDDEQNQVSLPPEFKDPRLEIVAEVKMPAVNQAAYNKVFASVSSILTLLYSLLQRLPEELRADLQNVSVDQLANIFMKILLLTFINLIDSEHLWTIDELLSAGQGYNFCHREHGLYIIALITVIDYHHNHLYSGSTTTSFAARLSSHISACFTDLKNLYVYNIWRVLDDKGKQIHKPSWRGFAIFSRANESKDFMSRYVKVFEIIQISLLASWKTSREVQWLSLLPKDLLMPNAILPRGLGARELGSTQTSLGYFGLNCSIPVLEDRPAKILSSIFKAVLTMDSSRYRLRVKESIIL